MPPPVPPAPARPDTRLFQKLYNFTGGGKPRPYGMNLRLLLFLLLTSCSGLRYVPEKEQLYTGSRVKINFPAKPPNAAALQAELASVLRPKPNSSLLGLRPKLYFWHLGVGKTKGLGKLLADKLGQAPVLLSQVKIAATQDLMTNRLHNNGYFRGRTSSVVNKKDKTATVDYTAEAGPLTTWQTISFPARDTLVDAAIRASQPGSLLKVDDAYNLNLLTLERLRIDAYLKDHGYYYFGPDLLLFQVDTTLGKSRASVDIRVKAEAPRRALQPYRLRAVTLNTNYVLTDTTTRPPVMSRGFRYLPDEQVFKAVAITRATFLFPDSLYRRRRRDQTLSRLMSLGTFKFVEIRFRQVADSLQAVARSGGAVPAPANTPAANLRYGPGLLDADVLMTQIKKKSLRAEVQLVSKSNGFTGPGVRVTYRNRSALRGAEQLLVNGIASFETQTQGAANNSSGGGLTSYELGVDAQLLIPRLVVPDIPFLSPRLPNSDFQPRTTVGAGIKTVVRASYFRQDVFNINYGYSWKKKITNEQQLTPIDVAYARVGSQSPEFEALLAARPFLASSFRQQFILASSYRYTFNQQVLEQRRQQLYFGAGVEVAGNLAATLSGALGQARNENKAYTLAGQEFSQYTKFDVELREYYRLSHDPAKGNRLVGRLLVGLGLPYGNARVLPYLRQYGIGGPNSVRAFAARSLGPGTYRTTAETLNGFYDQVGDLRLEANAEYRQDLFPYVKGAVFIDAGNIWLANDDPSRPGGQFKPGTFLQQLNVGAGLGLRIDVQFFVIRLDYAVPLQAAYGPPTSTAGRLNLAIGYPF